MTLVSLVVAVAKNGAIGVDGGLPWRLPGDLAFFKRVTMGKPLVMGRKTWESLPRKPLPGRPNLVVTRQAGFAAEGAEVFAAVDAALDHAATLGEEIAVIGGAEIYRQTLARADRLYLTEVDAEPEADTFFPTFDRGDWREVWREPGPGGDDASAPDYAFVLLERLPAK
jgi:dihydrofolate reductase